MQVGDVIDERYELSEVLGESGLGVVFKAHDLEQNAWVVVKSIFGFLPIGEKSVQRLFREARAANDIGSDAIARVVDARQASTGEPYLVRDYLEGSDLYWLLQREGPLEPERAVGLILQATRALDLAHQRGMAHWDLRPGNLFVTCDTQGDECIRILDFGIARFRDAVGSRDPEGSGAGSNLDLPHYMPLEMAQGSDERDHRVDIYSLGAMLYELIAGRKAYDAESHSRLVLLLSSTDPTPLATLRPGVSDKLSKIIARAMARDPNARYLSMAELCRALSSLTEDELQADLVKPPAEEAPKGKRPRREMVSTRPDLPRMVVDKRKDGRKKLEVIKTIEVAPEPSPNDSLLGSDRDEVSEPSQKNKKRAASSAKLSPLLLVALALAVVVFGAGGAMLFRALTRGNEVTEPDSSLHPNDVGFVDDRGGRGWGDRCFYHLSSERYDAARAACERGLQIAVDNEVRGTLIYNLGRIAQGEGDVAEARRLYEDALRLSPNNPAVRSRLEALDREIAQ
jgi:serine/threonine protein kinase